MTKILVMEKKSEDMVETNFKEDFMEISILVSVGKFYLRQYVDKDISNFSKGDLFKFFESEDYGEYIKETLEEMQQVKNSDNTIVYNINDRKYKFLEILDIGKWAMAFCIIALFNIKETDLIKINDVNEIEIDVEEYFNSKGKIKTDSVIKSLVRDSMFQDQFEAFKKLGGDQSIFECLNKKANMHRYLEMIKINNKF